MTLRERMSRQVAIRVWQVVGITAALSLTWATGIYGAWLYFDRQDYAGCIARNELRADVRQAFQVGFGYLETLGVDPEVGAGFLAAIDGAIPPQPC